MLTSGVKHFLTDVIQKLPFKKYEKTSGSCSRTQEEIQDVNVSLSNATEAFRPCLHVVPLIKKTHTHEVTTL